jgi:hypothetical protein
MLVCQVLAAQPFEPADLAQATTGVNSDLSQATTGVKPQVIAAACLSLA